jgi:cytochrome c biogenesis protein CcmG, thiol:disulfide interchange protein DsbE
MSVYQKKRSPFWIASCLIAALFTFVFASGCSSEKVPLCEGDVCLFPVAEEQASSVLPDTDGAPRFTLPKTERLMWASHRLYTLAPELDISNWIGTPPDTEGKYILIEFWRSWCSACKKSVSKLNRFHEKYKDDFVVIAMTGESEQAVRKKYTGPKMNYPIALDTPSETSKQRDQGIYEEKFGVWGWPHVNILEPEEGVVIWEGFCDLEGYELTDEIMDRIVAVGRKLKADAVQPKAEE